MANRRIYIPDEDEYGIVLSYGTFASLVKYSLGGVDYQVMLLNEDFIVLEEEDF